MSNDTYQRGGRTYRRGPEVRFGSLGSMGYDPAVKRPRAPRPSPDSLHSRGLRLAGLVIVVMIAADVLGSAWANGSEILWVALGAVVIAAAAAARVVQSVRRRNYYEAQAQALAQAEPRAAIAGDRAPLGLEAELRQAEADLRRTKDTLAEVLFAARQHQDRT